MEIHCQRDNDLLENVTSSLSRPMSSRKTMKRLKSGKMPSTKDPFDLPAHRPTDPQTATTYCGAQSYIWMICFSHNLLTKLFSILATSLLNISYCSKYMHKISRAGLMIRILPFTLNLTLEAAPIVLF